MKSRDGISRRGVLPAALAGLALLLALLPRPARAAITDNDDHLIVPAGESYTINGGRSKRVSIEVDGSLIVTPYAQGGASGALELVAPTIRVGASGRISADAAGFGSAAGPGAGLTSYDSPGGGGAYGGHGGYTGFNVSGGGAAYGALMQPLELGSGGGYAVTGWRPTVDGGRGGGRLKLNATAVKVDGTVSANGGEGVDDGWYGKAGGGGAGGAVLIGASTLEGSGSITADGGRSPRNGGGGGGGRVVVTFDSSVFAGTVAARGGAGFQPGGAGTVVYGRELRVDNALFGAATPILAGSFAFDRVSVAGRAVAQVSAGATLSAGGLFVQGQSTLTSHGTISVESPVSVGGALLDLRAGTLSAGELRVEGGALSFNGGGYSGTRIVVGQGAVMTLNSALVVPELEVKAGGVLTHSQGVAAFDLTAKTRLLVEAGGRISADAAGYASDLGPGAGATAYDSPGGGGGYGGEGGKGGGYGPAGGRPYGSLAQPQELGSGGGKLMNAANPGMAGGRGGGRLRIDATTLRLDGRISVDGEAGQEDNWWGKSAGGGSGGAVLLTASVLEGSGVVSASGGRSPRNGGGGGGGRVAVYYGSKTGAPRFEALGGAGYKNGGAGVILDNGQILGFDASPSSKTVSYTQMQPKLESDGSLVETLGAQTLDFSGATSTGVSPGTLSTAEMQLVTVKTGPFAGKGFFRGRWSLALGAGQSLSGDWEGVAFLISNPQRMAVKGVLKGQVRAVLEGYLDESSPGSGNFDRLAVGCRAVQVGSALGAGDLYLQGGGVVKAATEYPGTNLRVLQGSLTGEIAGSYAGPIDTTFSLLRVNSPGHAFDGEGLFAPSYASALGSGSGWAYANKSYGGAVTLSGILSQPLWGLFEGWMTESPRSLMLTMQRLDEGMPFEAELAVDFFGPVAVSPLETHTFSVELRNEGYTVAEGVTVVAVLPEHTDFVSASGEYVKYNVAHWRNEEYSPQIFLRWDLAQVPPRSTIKMHYQARIRLPGPAAPEQGASLGGGAHVVTRVWADEIFGPFEVRD